MLFRSFLVLESVAANGIFQYLNKLFSDNGALKYTNLAGLGGECHARMKEFSNTYVD